jgi:hypothetical protein
MIAKPKKPAPRVTKSRVVPSVPPVFSELERLGLVIPMSAAKKKRELRAKNRRP